MGNRAKVLQDPMSRHNMTNPNKLKLVNYNRTICNTGIYFGRENFDDSTRTHQICQTFLLSKFCAIRYKPTKSSQLPKPQKFKPSKIITHMVAVLIVLRIS